MQYEMNVTNRCTTNQRRLESRRDQKRKAKQGGAVTCGNTTSDLMTTHLSNVFALHAELIELSDSALTCTCILMPLSPICQSAHSLMGESSVSTTGM